MLWTILSPLFGFAVGAVGVAGAALLVSTVRNRRTGPGRMTTFPKD